MKLNSNTTPNGKNIMDSTNPPRSNYVLSYGISADLEYIHNLLWLCNDALVMREVAELSHVTLKSVTEIKGGDL